MNDVKIVRLGDICEPKQWKTLSMQELKPNGFPVYGANGKIGFYSEYNHKEPTLMVTCRGATCGSINVSEPYSWINGNAMCLDNLSVNVDFKYLEHYLRNYDFNLTITGTAQPQITRENINKIQIKLYSLQTQKQIASRLDLCADTISKHKKLLELHETLIKSQFVKMFGDPVTNPMGWEVKKFKDLCLIITDGEHATPKRTTKGIYLLSARNIHNHQIVLNDVDYIDENEYLRISKRIIPQEGDVLISCSGSVGRVCSVPKNLKFQLVRSVALLRLKPEISSIFMEYLISSDFLQGQIEKSKTQSTQANLFQGKIAELKGYVPPLPLQQNFATFVQQVEKSKQSVQKSLQKAETLYKALMQKYFN